jgi:hypothetical protein
MTSAEAAIAQLFQQPASRTGKLVKVSDEQLEELRNVSAEEQKEMIHRIYQEGKDERTKDRTI